MTRVGAALCLLPRAKTGDIAGGATAEAATIIVTGLNRFLLRLLPWLLLAGLAPAQDELPSGYRGWPYKAPTPLSVPGATTLFFAEDVQALIETTDILLVNVASCY